MSRDRQTPGHIAYEAWFLEQAHSQPSGFQRWHLLEAGARDAWEVAAQAVLARPRPEEDAPGSGSRAGPGWGSRHRPGRDPGAGSSALAAQQAAFPGVQAQAQRLYAAYVAGLGPLGVGLPPWEDLIDRQQFAWRCVARAQGEGQA